MVDQTDCPATSLTEISMTCGAKSGLLGAAHRAQPLSPLEWEVFEIKINDVLRCQGLEHTLKRGGEAKDTEEHRTAGMYVRRYLHPEDLESVQTLLDVHQIMDELKRKVDRRHMVQRATALEDLLKIKNERFPTPEKFASAFQVKVSLVQACGYPVSEEQKLEWLLIAIRTGASTLYDRIINTPSYGYSETLDDVASVNPGCIFQSTISPTIATFPVANIKGLLILFSDCDFNLGISGVINSTSSSVKLVSFPSMIFSRPDMMH